MSENPHYIHSHHLSTYKGLVPGRQRYQNPRVPGQPLQKMVYLLRPMCTYSPA